VLHLVQLDHPDSRSNIQRPTVCGEWAAPDDLVLRREDASCVRCLEVNDADAAALVRELEPTRSHSSLPERVAHLETVTVDLARELAAVRQLVEQLKLGTADALKYLDRGDPLWRRHR